VQLQPAWGQGPLVISCEGTESNGGGARNYQYTLKNTGAVAVTLTLFYVGTEDLNAANYTNWTAPAGFTPTATVADWTTLFNLYQTSVMGTTRLKTPHGVVPPQTTWPSSGGVAWSGNAVINPNQVVTFGFDNPHKSWDMEWFAEHPDPVNSSQAYLHLAIAGPAGVYTQGYVHGPTIEPVPVEQSTFGRIKALYRN
jgi:hypothetical protein